MIEQVTFRELAEDKIFRIWTQTKPKAPDYATWRVYVQRDQGGPWAKRDFKKWRKACLFLMAHQTQWYDSALIARNWPSTPPIIRREVGKSYRREYYVPMLTVDGHQWCTFCRRPTVFATFENHHAFTGHTRPMRWVVRCSICGINQTQVRRFN